MCQTSRTCAAVALLLWALLPDAASREGATAASRSEVRTSVPQGPLWRLPDESSITGESAARAFSALVDPVVLDELLSHAAVNEEAAEAAAGPAAVLTLPWPDGSFVRFRIVAASAAGAGSSALHAYHGYGVDDSDLAARIERTEDGLYAVVSGRGDMVYVDPASFDGNSGRHVSYHARNAGRPLVAGGGLPLGAVRQIEVAMDRKAQRTPAQRKVSSGLLDAARVGVANPSLDTDDEGRVLVDITAAVTPALLDRIEALGGIVIDSVPRYRAIRARLPMEAVEPLAAEDAVQRVEPADRAITHGESSARSSESGYKARDGPSRANAPARSAQPIAGPGPGLEATVHTPAVAPAMESPEAVTVPPGVEYHKRDTYSPLPDSEPTVRQAAGSLKENKSEGDAAHDAPTARTRYDVDGSGIGIGVLSSGVQTLADRQATGDLPESVTVLPAQEGEGDEGTAMLEIVHDLAPGAHLYFATAQGGQARFAENIEALCEAGADIIVDDVYYITEGAFQDDVVAQGINAATAAGCFHFTPAGNMGNLDHGTASVWEGDFVPAASAPAGIAGVVHDFGGIHSPGANSNGILRAVELPAQLKWADPLGASSNDYDLYLFDETLTTLLDSSTDSQTGTEDPYEVIWTREVGARLVVVKAGGDDRYLRLDLIRGGLEYATSGHTFAHMAARNAISTAAVDARTAGGPDGVFDGSESVETFSADGPRRIFFASDGTALTPGNFSSTGGERLAKPDIAAADGVSTATPGFEDFHGTSAAAPHAAALGALVLQGAGGPRRVTPAALRSALIGASLDIEAPGHDRNAGAGIPLAPAAVAALRRPGRQEPPEITNSVDDLTLLVLGDPTPLDLSGRFRDPRGGSVSLRVLSSDPSIVTATLEGTQLTLAPLGRGLATITVLATSSDGLSVQLSFDVTVDRAWGAVDYDVDNDGLIEIRRLEQLEAVRHDLDGDALEDTPAAGPLYFEAFEGAARGMGCPRRCTGYELIADLDFDAPSSYATGRVDRGWSKAEGGPGWEPIGTVPADRTGVRPRYSANFDGNGHAIANLFIDRPERVDTGLFGRVGGTRRESRTIRGVRLIDVDVTGHDNVGGLIGTHSDLASWEGKIATRHNSVTGRVSGRYSVGGLAGSGAQIAYSFAAVEVSGESAVGGLAGTAGSFGAVTVSYATGRVSGDSDVGGLVGHNNADIVACYATGHVAGGRRTGGLVGYTGARVSASYATARVTGGEATGGLIGVSTAAVLHANYWDVETSGASLGVGGDDSDGSGSIDSGETPSVGVEGRTTAELTGPVRYEGFFANWNVAVERSAERGYYFLDEQHDPWDFGSPSQYPALKGDWDQDGVPTWTEFGDQLRERIELSVAANSGEVTLNWTTPKPRRRTSLPDVGYTVYRDAERLVDGIRVSTYRDVPPADGTTQYEYRVAAAIGTGEPVRSHPVSVRNRPPRAAPVADRSARVGAPFRYRFDAATDPDGDAVHYTVGTLPGWLTFEATGRSLVGTPDEGDLGTVEITLTVTDSGTPTLSGSTTFALTVNPATPGNQPPEAVRMLDAVTLATGDMDTVALAGTFRDPDGDALEYAATSAGTHIATAEVVGASLVVTAMSAGSTSVTVTASDGSLGADQVVGVEVLNAPPRPTEPMARVELTVPGAPVRVDLSTRFDDPDGDALSFAVESSAREIVLVEQRSAALIITPVAGGTATLGVSATDEEGSGATARLSLHVTVRRDYDADDDGLIEIVNLAQLDAVRHDLNGDAVIGGGSHRTPPAPDAAQVYAAAFPHPTPGMGCVGGCIGYELRADLDFDTNGNGRPDPGDRFWNRGLGWKPLGGFAGQGGIFYGVSPETSLRAVFEGNGHTVTHLFIDRPEEGGIGLFGLVWWDGLCRNLRLVGVDVRGKAFTGAFIGNNEGALSNVSATGTVTGWVNVGGLVGSNGGDISASRAHVVATGLQTVGGLIGTVLRTGTVTRTYATGNAVGRETEPGRILNVGGLIGINEGKVAASYATGTAGGADRGSRRTGWLELEPGGDRSQLHDRQRPARVRRERRPVS